MCRNCDGALLVPPFLLLPGGARFEVDLGKGVTALEVFLIGKYL